MLIELTSTYEPVQALNLIWRPPWVHFGVLLNIAKMSQIVYFIFARVHGTMIIHKIHIHQHILNYGY